ncbi:MAG: glutamate--tRNA ligase family protein [Planctomycetota bacterium]
MGARAASERSAGPSAVACTRRPATGRRAFGAEPDGPLALGPCALVPHGVVERAFEGRRVGLEVGGPDVERVRPGMVEATIADLLWLGVDWDGAPVLQSTLAEGHARALQRLIAADLVYPCVCTRRELAEASSAPNRGAASEAYPGTCRGRFSSREEALERTGRDAALRFRTPPGRVQFEDRLHGVQSIDVASEVGDFPVTRRDGALAYQLAVVVDDAAQAVTDVVRGDDLLTSTARQVLLQRALAVPSPSWLHVPLVEDHTGRRLAKRDDDLSLATLRASGVSPASIATWAARTAGLTAAGPESSAEPAAAWLERYQERTLTRSPTRLNPPPAPPL